MDGVHAVPGQWLGEWLLGEPLGRGAFATVFRARDPESGREAAIKVPTDPRYAERLRSQGRALALEHPGIVRTLAQRLDQEPPHLVLELVSGGSLRQALSAGPLAPGRAVAVVADVAAALDHAHAAGVLHLDVKPENVLLDAEGRARLVDFGGGDEASVVRHSLAASEDALRAVSTRDYAAPELRYGDTDLDRRADVYGLGVLAFELLTGRLPLGLDRPSELRPELPAAVDDVLARALARDPARRTLSAGELAVALRRAIAPSERVPEQEGGRPSRHPPPRAPRGRLAWFVAAGVFAVLAVAVAEFRALELPRGPRSEGRFADAILDALPPGTARLGLLPPEDLRDRWDDLATILHTPRAELVPLHPAGGPETLFERAARDELARTSACAYAIHSVGPDARLPQRLQVFVIDLPSYEVVAAGPVVEGPARAAAARIAAHLRQRGDRRPLAVLPTVDAGLRVSNQSTALFDAQLTAALAQADCEAPIRARAGIVERLRASGGDVRRALSVAQVVEGEVDAPAGVVRLRLRDLETDQVALVLDQVPLRLERYEPTRDAERLSVDLGPVALLPHEGDDLLARALDAAGARLFRGHPREAVQVLEALRARGEPYASALEPLLLLARAHREAGDVERALALYAEAVGLHPDAPELQEAYARLCLSEAERLYQAGKRRWYQDDDEAQFRAALALLERTAPLAALSEGLRAELSAARAKLEREL